MNNEILNLNNNSNVDLSSEGLQKKYLEETLVTLSLQKERLKKEMEDINSKLDEVLKGLGLGHMFQAQDGTVFRVSKPAGTFITFREIDYDRTRREGEKSGSLSLTDARNAGFEVK